MIEQDEYDEQTDSLKYFKAILENKGFGGQNDLCPVEFILDLNITVELAGCNPSSVYGGILSALRKTAAIVEITDIHSADKDAENPDDWFLNLEPVKAQEIWDRMLRDEVVGILSPGL